MHIPCLLRAYPLWHWHWAGKQTRIQNWGYGFLQVGSQAVAHSAYCSPAGQLWFPGGGETEDPGSEEGLDPSEDDELGVDDGGEADAVGEDSSDEDDDVSGGAELDSSWPQAVSATSRSSSRANGTSNAVVFILVGC